MMIVDGKYIIESKGSYENILKVVDYVLNFKDQILKNYEK